MSKKKKHWPSTPPAHPPMHPGGRKWETIAVDDGPVYTQRMLVPGGWIYRVIGIWLQAHGGNMVSMCFVPLWEEPPPGWGSS